LDKIGGVILAAGRGERMGASLNKAFLPLGDRPLLLHSIATFEAASLVDAYIVVASPEEIAFCRVLLAPYSLQKLVAVVPGGLSRQESAAAGVRALPEEFGLVAVHDAARPLLSVELLEGAVKRAAAAGYPDLRVRCPEVAVVVAVPVKDTIKMVDSTGLIRETPVRDGLWTAQTPQIFQRDLLLRAYAEAERDGFSGTDDASLVERLGVPVAVYLGSDDNFKVTTPEDLRIAQMILGQRSRQAGLLSPAPAAPGSGAASPVLRPAATPGRPLVGACVRMGIGYDVHPFDPGRSLVLGGVEIPEGPGLAGHSDADVALHALMDACLGAAGLRDIGHHFPPGDRRWKDAPSLALLADVRSILAAAGYLVSQVDLVIAAEAPRLAPFIDMMQRQVGAVLGILPGNVGIKATTSEGLGFVGRKEGICAWAVATIVSNEC
jgi:2-C-methyl-D-erythritol 4-phosphate cytidylyltransferase/2-C-methyl-D-erythritol 2,4-cyclodiphosphate synthase